MRCLLLLCQIRLWRITLHNDSSAAADSVRDVVVDDGDDDAAADLNTPGPMDAPMPFVTALHSIALAGLERPRIMRLPLATAAPAGGVNSASSSCCYEVLPDALCNGHEGWVTSVAWQPPRVIDGSTGRRLWQPPCIVSASVDKSIVAWAPALSAADPPTNPMGGFVAVLSRGAWEPVSRTGGAGAASLGMLGAVLCADGATLVAHSLQASASSLMSSSHLSAVVSSDFAFPRPRIQGALHVWTSRQRRCVASPASSSPDDLLLLADWGAVPAPSGHFGPVADVSWGADGLYCISASEDATTRVWAPCERAPLLASSSCSQEGALPQWHEVGRPQIHGYAMVAVAAASIPSVPHRFFSAGK
jgi:elongator complex protein 2